MTIDDLKKRIDALLSQAEAALHNVRGNQFDSSRAMQSEDWTALRAAGLAFIARTFGRDHSHYREFDKALESSYDYHGRYAVGVLRAIRDEIYGGWIDTTRGLVAAEVFADFIEMADHLLDAQYKDPAAVMVGSVLEEHLRHLCDAAGIPTDDSHASGQSRPRKADALNADLAKAARYTKLDQKQITAWLDLRNKAAHGRYGEYTKEQVVLMLGGVRDFITRVRP